MGSLPAYALSSTSPTDDQLAALQMLDAFFEENQSCFLLKGYAGTGKTWLLGIIVSWLNKNNRPFMLMAPTGRAARVLARKTGNKASTIHKAIYNFENLEEVVIHTNGKMKYKFRYNLNRMNTPGMVYIVDEASMISDRTNESDFFVFGSGKLLTDLIDFAAPENLDNRVKIIFTGDPAQLPPVGDPLSGALDKEYLTQQFSIAPSEYELTRVVRQESANEILSLATSLRNSLQMDPRPPVSFSNLHQDVNQIGPGDVVENFIRENPSFSKTSSIIINYGNKASLDYNMAVREKRFPGKSSVQTGDNLMIVQNNYNYVVELFNGTLVKVIHVDEYQQVKGNMLSFDQTGKECRVSHTFRKVTIEVEEGNTLIPVECMILEDFLLSPDPQPDYAQNIALYLDFKIRHPHLSPGTKPFSDALRMDPWFNALRVKYGYAITCHKAQGGEWDTVFLNMDVSMGKLSKPYLRWVYTAVTRARNKLYLYNTSKETQFSHLKYLPKLLPGASAATERPELIFEKTRELETWISETGAGKMPPFILERLREIRVVAWEYGITLSGRKSENFCEVISFRHEGKTACLKFWYNSKNKFTSVQVFPNGTNDFLWGDQLKGVFSQPVTIHMTEGISSAGNEDGAVLIQEILWEEGMDLLRNLYEALVSLLEGKGIQISGITHQSYAEVYHFTRGSEKAVVQFYFNGKFQFTTAQPMLAECNSNELLAELSALITELTQS